jgi:conserved oligomeric Golgi complex subunit 3
MNYLQIDNSLDALNKLTKEYEFVNTKTSSLNTASENLLQEQTKLNEINEEIRHRLKHFTQAEHISQRLQNPTFSPSSDQFAEIMNTIDECLEYLKEHVSLKIA